MEGIGDDSFMPVVRSGRRTGMEPGTRGSAHGA